MPNPKVSKPWGGSGWVQGSRGSLEDLQSSALTQTDGKELFFPRSLHIITPLRGRTLIRSGRCPTGLPSCAGTSNAQEKDITGSHTAPEPVSIRPPFQLCRACTGLFS